MSDKPKRPWFRFHLATAVVIMLAAGLAVWVNFSWPEAAVADLDYKRIVGFPFAFIGQQGNRTEILYGELVLNVAFWLAALSYIAFVSERFVRGYDAPE